MEKRYAIVKVDRDNEDFKCPTCPSVAQSCCDCKIVETYGDTKEQMIRKVAQIILKAWFEDKLKPSCEKISFEIAVAKEIVEFLGVK